MKIGIINGPNLNLLGSREKDIYGEQSFEDFLTSLQNRFPQVDLEYFQSNHEGELVDKIHYFGKQAQAIIFNPGAFTHTSIAIGDAVGGVNIPVYEVHISNIYKRENFRKHSYVSAKAKAVITGFGLEGYALVVESLIATASI